MGLLGSIATIVGEGLKLLNNNVFNAKRRAKKLEEEKKAALKKAKELAYGDDAKALEKYISDLPD